MAKEKIIYKRKCKNCGKDFETTKKNKIFCCTKCTRKYGEKHRKPRRYVAHCANCGKELIRARNVTEKEPLRFCNAKCASEYRNSHNEERKCVVCGTPFIPNRSNHLCCCRKCKDAYMNYQEERECVICGKKFHTYSFSHTCSEECESELHALRTLENFENGKYPTSLTKIHVKINELLETMNIHYKNEQKFSRYSVDIYLTDYNLCIEIMGGYWHQDSRKFKKEKGQDAYAPWIKDKKKREIIKGMGSQVLYLWEDDINNNINLCKELILLFINNNGELENYQSSSYGFTKKNKLKYYKTYKKQYMEK